MMTHHRLVFVSIKVVEWRRQVQILEVEGKQLSICGDCDHPSIKAQRKSFDNRMATAIRKRNKWEAEAFAILNEDGGHENNLIEREIETKREEPLVEPEPKRYQTSPRRDIPSKPRKDGRATAIRRPLNNIVRGNGLTRG